MEDNRSPSPSPPPPPPPPGTLPVQVAQQEDVPEPAAKRQKLGASPPPGQPDQVVQALRKIAGSIGKPSKFVKAAALVRQLLAGSQLSRERHRQPLFEVLRASMVNPETSNVPELAREYSKLFTAASKHREMFGSRELAQLDVYGLWGVLRWQLATDDSFTFNKTLGSLKESISHLPDATPEDDAALEEAQVVQAADAARFAAGPGAAKQPAEAAPNGSAPPAGPVEQPLPAAAAEPEADAQAADPFGLDSLIPEPRQDSPAPEPLASEPSASEPAAQPAALPAWSSAQSRAMKRQALLDCIQAAREHYHKAWACTSVDLTIQFAREHREKFCAVHQDTLEELWRFVQQRRLGRRMGPSARERKRDSNVFENARADYSKIHISAKAAVGASGDHRTEQWLG